MGFFAGLIGALAGFYGGWFDRIVGRLSDLLMAFPSLLLGVNFYGLGLCITGFLLPVAWQALSGKR